MARSNLQAAGEFLARKRFALVGASRDEKSFSRYLLRELLRRGYEVVPVSPSAAELERVRCFPRVRDVVPAVDAALILTPPERTDDAVTDCLAAGVRRVWLHRGAGPGSATPEAIARCRAAGVEPILDLCPFMALPGAGWFHRLHGLLRGVHRRAASG